MERPRLDFAGRFEADVSTVNNSAANDATLLPEYDAPGVPVIGPDGNPTSDTTNGWWNLTGSGVWRLVGCLVTAAYSKKGNIDASDPIWEMLVTAARDRASAKLVDLNPMQQMVSTIFGLQLNLVDPNSGECLLSGKFAAAPFADIWFGRAVQGDASAFFQSQFVGPQCGGPIWSTTFAGSDFLREFRDTAGDLPLSIRMLADGFVTRSSEGLLPTGRVVGTISVKRQGEPRHFVRSRQLLDALNLKDPGNLHTPHS